MIDIQWKGKIGYGDIVSPICYAHNLSNKLQVPVNLTFRWKREYTHKIHSRDPEPLWQRAAYIEKLCYKGSTQVVIQHKFKHPLDIDHSNYDWNIVGKDSLHNYWFPRKPNNPKRDLIVVNSTEGNVISLSEYGKHWKDPAAPYWSSIISKLKAMGYQVEVVDYRTPTKDLTDLLCEAKGFVGYHGTAAWPAKFIHVPSLLFSNGGSLTSTSFPYAIIKKDATQWEKQIDSIEDILVLSKQLINGMRDKYKTYMPSKQFLKHLTHG